MKKTSFEVTARFKRKIYILFRRKTISKKILKKIQKKPNWNRTKFMFFIEVTYAKTTSSTLCIKVNLLVIFFGVYDKGTSFQNDVKLPEICEFLLSEPYVYTKQSTQNSVFISVEKLVK